MCEPPRPFDARDHVEALIKTFDRRALQSHYLSSPEARAFHEGRDTGLRLALAAIAAVQARGA